MSASEELKALSMSHAIDWPAPSKQAYMDAETYERNRKRIVLAALPQILAVVEAAENWEQIAREHTTPFPVPEPQRLRAALTALEEALS